MCCGGGVGVGIKNPGKNVYLIIIDEWPHLFNPIVCTSTYGVISDY